LVNAFIKQTYNYIYSNTTIYIVMFGF